MEYFYAKIVPKNHEEKFNFNISYIKEIIGTWDPYLLSYVTRGGNSRFINLCKEYQIDCMSLTENQQNRLMK